VAQARATGGKVAQLAGKHTVIGQDDPIAGAGNEAYS
jgi:hypothetical protein